MIASTLGRRAALVILPALLLATPPVHGQGEQVRDGFWFSVGGAFASNRTDCSNCSDVTDVNGTGFFLKAGGPVSAKVMLGGEGYGFFRSTDQGNLRITGLLAIAQWYPTRGSGFWFRPGIGLSRAKVSLLPQSGGSETIDRVGLGLALGVGWDFRVSRMISLSPVVSYYVNGLGAVNFSGGTLNNTLTQMGFFGAAVTFH